LEQIRANSPDAADQAISVYQVDHAYFVLDGHKRVALAMAEGRVFIDADVTEWLTRYHLDAATTMDALRLTDEERRFREITGLARGVPGARFPVSDPDGYLDLSESVKAHSFDLSVQRGELVDPAVAAAHWYETVFVPATQAAREAGYDRVLETCTDAERFLIMRRGNRAPFGRNWDFPVAIGERSFKNLRAATPTKAAAAAARLTRRPKRQPDLVREEDKDMPSD
jgi:hypothetical protein